MRIAVIYQSQRRSKLLAGLASSLAKGFEAQGHQVKVFDSASEQDIPLPAYEFVALLGESSGFLSSRIDSRLGKALSRSGRSTGKRSMAIVVKPCLRPVKTSLNLMDIMEKEGLVVIDCLAIAPKADEAELFFKRYRAER